MKKTLVMLVCLALCASGLPFACAGSAPSLPTLAPLPPVESTLAPTPVPTPIPTPVPTPVPAATTAPRAETGRPGSGGASGQKQDAAFIPGIGAYTGVYSVQVSSNYVNKDKSILVDGPRAIDGNLNTAWSTNSRIAGEWIQLAVQDNQKYMVAGFRIANGYWKNDNVYWKNPRVRTMEVYCDDQYVATYGLEDIVSYQTFWFADPLACSRIKFRIVDAYSGSAYKDCSITELELLGPDAAAGLLRGAANDWGSSVGALNQTVSSGGRVAKGDKGMAVVGLQLLLKEEFGALGGNVDGVFGSGTQGAVNAFAETMRNRLGSQAQPMSSGVVDQAYWNNILAYMDAVN